MNDFVFRRNGMYNMTVTITASSEIQAREILKVSVINPEYYHLSIVF